MNPQRMKSGSLATANPPARALASESIADANERQIGANRPKLTDQRKDKRRIRNPEVTRAKLLQAAVDLVAEKGADELSLREAAGLANVSRGIAYHYFKDRDQLLREAMKWVSRRLQQGVKRLDGAPLHDRVMDSTKFILGNPDICKLMIAEAINGRDLGRRAPVIKLVTKLLRQAIAEGRARSDVDVGIVAYVHFGVIATVLMLREQRKGGDMDVLAEQFTKEWTKILRRGLFLDEGGAKAPDRRAVTHRSSGAELRRK